MSTSGWTISAASVLLLASCSSSVVDGAPETLTCKVTHRATPEAEPDEATVEVDRRVGREGNNASLTFDEGREAELTFEVSYRATHATHGLVQIRITPPERPARLVQIFEFEREYSGGPDKTWEANIDDTKISVDYVCGDADTQVR